MGDVLGVRSHLKSFVAELFCVFFLYHLLCSRSYCDLNSYFILCTGLASSSVSSDLNLAMSKAVKRGARGKVTKEPEYESSGRVFESEGEEGLEIHM